MPDLGKGILKDWSKDITNYYDLIDAYLFKKTSDNPNFCFLELVEYCYYIISTYYIITNDF